MNRIELEFKKILLKIAQLTLNDQNWILNQLSTPFQKQFVQKGGVILLDEARQFAGLDHTKCNLTSLVELPNYAEELKQYPPLYTAIILEQGDFNWTEAFLNTTEQGDHIHHLMHEVVCKMKPSTKACVFDLWQKQPAYDFMEENAYG